MLGSVWDSEVSLSFQNQSFLSLSSGKREWQEGLGWGKISAAFPWEVCCLSKGISEADSIFLTKLYILLVSDLMGKTFSSWLLHRCLYERNSHPINEESFPYTRVFLTVFHLSLRNQWWGTIKYVERWSSSSEHVCYHIYILGKKSDCFKTPREKWSCSLVEEQVFRL